MKSFEEIFTLENLVKYGRQCCNGVRWKQSIQCFELHIYTIAAEVREELLNGTYKHGSFFSFKINERGKTRWIDALSIRDRMVQKCFCREALLPETKKRIIHENCASQKGKGFDFCIEKVTEALRRHYRLHGRDGYVLLMDFHNYFNSLNRSVIKQRFKELGPDDRTYNLFCKCVDAFDKRSTFRGLRTDIQKGIGVGLGSEVSQSIGIDYVSPVDHYCKDQMGIKGYARYMDDSLAIHESKEFLEELRDDLFCMAEVLGLEYNEKKCKIVPLTQEFTFLKIKFHLLETGKVVLKPNMKNIKKLKICLIKMRDNEDKKSKKPVPDGKIWESYQSSRSRILICKDTKLLYNLDMWFAKEFPLIACLHRDKLQLSKKTKKYLKSLDE